MEDRVLSVAAAQEIIRLMPPGASFAYYRGSIARDRDANVSGNPARAVRVAALADQMLRQACGRIYRLEDGTVIDGLGIGHLTQRKIESGVYEYLFTKSK